MFWRQCTQWLGSDLLLELETLTKLMPTYVSFLSDLHFMNEGWCSHKRHSHQVYERWVGALISIFGVLAFKLVKVDMEVRAPTDLS